MLKNWILVLYGSSEPIDKNDPVSIPLNRTIIPSAVAIPNTPRAQPAPSGSTTAAPLSTTTTSTTTTTAPRPAKGGKAKSQGKGPTRNKSQHQQSGNRKGNGKQDKNEKSELNGARKTPAVSQQYRKQGNGKPTFRPPSKQPKKEVQVFNELLQRKTGKAYKSSSAAEKTIKAPKQVKENTNNMRLQQMPRFSSSTNAPPSLVSQGDLTLTTSPSTASTASQTRLSKVLFQKYDRIQHVFPEFHPYVPPISESEKKASLFLAMPNPNSKKQGAEGAKAFRENGKIIFFSDPDFFPATTKPQQQRPSPISDGSTTTAVKEQQRNGIESDSREEEHCCSDRV